MAIFIFLVSGTSIVLHSSVSFAELNQDADPVNVKQEMLAHLDNVIPGLPSANESTLVNWKYSQVIKAHNDNAAFILNKFPLLIAGGDSFTTSRFDGCLLSASVMSKTIVDTLKSSSGNL